jgi:Zn-finger nucleic acid-binding protein
MNCPNCAAPMRLVRDHFVCDYCATFHFPSPAAGAPDGVQGLGQPADMACPVCHCALEAGRLEKQPVAHCRQCRGVLLAGPDFAEIVRVRRARYTGPTESPRAIEPAELGRRLQCPRCQRGMETHPYYGPGAVVIESCGECALVWLDHGELGIIEQAPGRR